MQLAQRLAGAAPPAASTKGWCCLSLACSHSGQQAMNESASLHAIAKAILSQGHGKVVSLVLTKGRGGGVGARDAHEGSHDVVSGSTDTVANKEETKVFLLRYGPRLVRCKAFAADRACDSLYGWMSPDSTELPARG